MVSHAYWCGSHSFSMSLHTFWHIQFSASHILGNICRKQTLNPPLTILWMMPRVIVNLTHACQQELACQSILPIPTCSRFPSHWSYGCWSYRCSSKRSHNGRETSSITNLKTSDNSKDLLEVSVYIVIFHTYREYNLCWRCQNIFLVFSVENIITQINHSHQGQKTSCFLHKTKKYSCFYFLSFWQQHLVKTFLLTIWIIILKHILCSQNNESWNDIFWTSILYTIVLLNI